MTMIDAPTCGVVVAAKRVSLQDPKTGRWRRTCSACGKTKDMKRAFFRARKVPKGDMGDWMYHCKRCQIQRVQEYKDRRRTNPSTQRAAREQQARWQKQWRERNRQREKEIARDYLRRRRQDPMRHAIALENQRIGRRLRAEREGKPAPRNHARGTRQPDVLPRLPVKPLLLVVDRLATGRENGYEELSKDLGITSRTFRRWREEDGTVQFDLVDKVLTLAGLLWFEVWTEDEYPELHAELAA